MEPIRVIETGHPFGGRLAHVYAFCLPRSLQERQGELVERMRKVGAPYGVEQYSGDDAGILVYAREGADNVRLCEEFTAFINGVLGTQLVFELGMSVNFVVNYGHWPGATTYASLLERPGFVLPYMTN